MNSAATNKLVPLRAELEVPQGAWNLFEELHAARLMLHARDDGEATREALRIISRHLFVLSEPHASAQEAAKRAWKTFCDLHTTPPPYTGPERRVCYVSLGSAASREKFMEIFFAAYARGLADAKKKGNSLKAKVASAS